MSLHFKSKKCYTLADGKNIQNFVERHLQLLREGIPEICGINGGLECAPVKSNSIRYQSKVILFVCLFILKIYSFWLDVVVQVFNQNTLGGRDR